MSSGILDTYKHRDRYSVVVQIGQGKEGLPAVPPLAEALAVERVRTRDGHQSGDSGVHAFEANWTCGQLNNGCPRRTEAPQGHRDRIIGVNAHGQYVNNMTSLWLEVQ